MKAIDFINLFNKKAKEIDFPYLLSYPTFIPQAGLAVITPERKSFTIILNQDNTDLILLDTYYAQDGRGLVLAALIIQLLFNCSQEASSEALEELGLLDQSFLEGKETFMNKGKATYQLHTRVVSSGFLFQITKE